MEICQHGIRRPELITRIDEQSCLPPRRCHCALDRANTRGAYAESPLCRSNLLGIAVRDFEMLLMQLDVFEPFLTQRCERAESYVQSDVSDLRSSRPALFEHRGSEMQARRRRCG